MLQWIENEAADGLRCFVTNVGLEGHRRIRGLRVSSGIKVLVEPRWWKKWRIHGIDGDLCWKPYPEGIRHRARLRDPGQIVHRFNDGRWAQSKLESDPFLQLLFRYLTTGNTVSEEFETRTIRQLVTLGFNPKDDIRKFSVQLVGYGEKALEDCIGGDEIWKNHQETAETTLEEDTEIPRIEILLPKDTKGKNFITDIAAFKAKLQDYKGQYRDPHKPVDFWRSAVKKPGWVQGLLVMNSIGRVSWHGVASKSANSSQARDTTGLTSFCNEYYVRNAMSKTVSFSERFSSIKQVLFDLENPSFTVVSWTGWTFRDRWQLSCEESSVWVKFIQWNVISLEHTHNNYKFISKLDPSENRWIDHTWKCLK